jgi:hypothetical protein
MGIIESEEFKEVFFERSYRLLSKEAEKYDDIYDNDLDIQLNLYIYLILHDLREELVKLLKEDIELQKDIIFENGKNYWNLPLFRNSKLKIPDRLFEIKSIRRFFVNFDNLVLEDDFITIENIKIPKDFPIKKGEVVFIGRTPEDELLEDNKRCFELEAVNDDNISDTFKAKIPTNELSSVEEYDILLEFIYLNDESDKFRISKNNFKKIINKSKYLGGYLTANNNLTIRTLMVKDAFRIEPMADSLNLIVNDDVSIKKPLEIYVQNKRSHEKVSLTSIENKLFKIEWEYFLDKGSEYEFYLKFNKKSRLNEKSILKFKDLSFKNNGTNIKIYKTNKGDIALKG